MADTSARMKPRFGHSRAHPSSICDGAVRGRGRYAVRALLRCKTTQVHYLLTSRTLKVVTWPWTSSQGLHSDSCPIRASLAAMVGRAHPGPEFKPRDASSIVEKIRTCVNVHSGYGHLEVNIIQTIDAAGKCISKHRRYVLRAHMMSRMGRFINPGIRCLVAGPQNLWCHKWS